MAAGELVDPIDAQAALAEAAAAGIHCIPIPTPFLVGRVNCYLIEDDPLTLVDTGPNSGKALDELEQALAARGHRIEDLGLIVVTHQHIDHIGLLEVLARRSGAEVAALARLQGYLGDYRGAAERDDAFAVALMLRHGIPADVTQALRAVSSAFRGWGSGAPVTRPLGDDSRLALRDRTLSVMHRPGHSPSDTVFWDERRRILLGGDHLIKHISSNPLIARPLDGDDPTAAVAERPQALRTYVASLAATRELDARIVLSGHGEPVTDHRRLIDERFSLTERRARKIHGLLGDERLTAHELAQRMWGNVAVTQAFLTLSEVLGHLDLLERRRHGARARGGRGRALRGGHASGRLSAPQAARDATSDGYRQLVVADPPETTPAVPACAWCEQPLAHGPLRPFGQLRCERCGATTALDWPAERGLVPAFALPAASRRVARRLCTLSEAARRSTRRRLAARIARVAPPGPVLDVGSGDGMLLDALRATGRLTTGIVAGSPAVAPRAGVQEADITELGGRYAAIVFWQTLGRLHAPGMALDHAAALLKPGGLLTIAQPRTTRVQARALGERVLAPGVPRHRVLIPPQALMERLRALGLQAERIDHLLDLPTPGGWLQGALGGVTAIEARR